MINITDTFGRSFKSLRISLTNTCNLACTYCVETSTTKQNIIYPINTNHQKNLSVEQYVKIVTVLNSILDIDCVRLTGGEPTLFKNLIPLIKGLKDAGIQEIKMTSNGTLLTNKLSDLKQAGLTSLNISLDAMDADVYSIINKRSNLKNVLMAIDKAIEQGIQIKLNCVIMKGVNDKQIIKLFEYCKNRNIVIRFLELMQMGHLHKNFEQLFFSEAEILNTIALHYAYTPIGRAPSGTASYWITNDQYQFGIISNESHPFCKDCNRLRLDSYGNIYGCLSDNNPINITDSLLNDNVLIKKLTQALGQKKTKFVGSDLSMLHIGG